MRRTPSLVRLLFLWQSVALTVALGVLAVLLFLVAGRRLRRHHDDVLRAAVEQAGAIVESTPAGDADGLRARADELRLDVVLSELARLEPLPAEELRTVVLENSSQPEIDDGSFPAHHEPGTPVRVASGVFQTPDGAQFLVRASENLGDVSSTLRSLQFVLLTFTPLVLALSIGVGAWIIHKTLRPLRTVVRAAGSMDVNQLNDRLSLEGGSAEVTQLVRSFNQMIERLALSFERVRQFSANASHELRTPLTALTSSLEVGLEKRRTEDEYREIMEQALLDVRHLTRIVENLLVMAQTDTGQVGLATAPVDLEDILAASIEAILIRHGDSGVEIHVEDTVACTVDGDPHWLRQLFDNLLDNAVKYTPAGGSVRIETRTKERVVEIAIEDEGTGIAEDELPRIFERYHRAPAAEDDGTPGVGLGLSIAEWVAGAHDGRIEIESTLGRGSRFTVVLPRTRG